MFLELLNDLFLHSSILYVYFGIVFTTIGVIRLFSNQYAMWQNRTNLLINDRKNIKVKTAFMDKPFVVNKTFINWFVIMFRRVDKRDGKTDTLPSNFINDFKIRGGIVWKKTAYSLSLKIIGFSF